MKKSTIFLIAGASVFLVASTWFLARRGKEKSKYEKA
jgi:LPXTG-motif cell wall-anchored protein